MSLVRNKNKQPQRPRPQDTYVRKSKYNKNPFEISNDVHLSDDNNNDEDNNNLFDDNNSIYHLSDDNNFDNDDEDNNNLFDDNNSIYPSEDENNSNNSYLSEDNDSDFSQNNNSSSSDLFEDNDSDFSQNNNNSISDLSEGNSEDVEMDTEENNFKNITSLMMFTWITKHMIGNSAYKDLINIIHNKNFNLIDVPKNIQTLKEQRKYLPLHKIKKNIVNINKEKTSSNSPPTKISYSISIFDHIRTILNNPQIHIGQFKELTDNPLHKTFSPNLLNKVYKMSRRYAFNY